MPEVFGNLKDSNERLTQHTYQILGELGDFIQKWNNDGLDGRAIFVAITTFRDYYSELARQRFGDTYAMALEVQASKLADGMLGRNDVQKTQRP